MTEKVKKFKEYIEGIAEHNFDDYDAVEYLEGYNCAEYNAAVTKINNYNDVCDVEAYKELFTEEEMLTVSIMYACIVTGAIKSHMTEKLKASWEKFVNDLDAMAYSCNLARLQ